LLALETEIRSVLKPGMEHRVSHVRMEWWRAEADRLSAGTPAHPLTRALKEDVGSDTNISGLIDATIWDLAAATFGSRAEVTGYCERWASTMIEPVVRTVVPDSLAFANRFGVALRELELLADLAQEAHAGRLRLPLDELEREGIDPDALAKPPWPAKLCGLLMTRHRALRAALGASIASVSGEHQAAMRGLLVWAALAHRRSITVERALPNVPQPSRVAAIKELWAAWRAARHASRGTFKLTQESIT